MSLVAGTNSKLHKLLIVTAGHNSVKNYLQISMKCSCLAGENVQKRTVFNFSSVSTRKEYNGRKLIGYTMDQLFNVVSDVENYNKFVPWCKKSIVSDRKPNNLRAELVVGFPPINERYTSDVTLVRPYLVKAECSEGRLFNHLMTLWRFSPGLQNSPNSCVIDFRVMFEFRSALHSTLATLFFDQVVLQMEGAFINETRRRYGKASLPMKVIKMGRTVNS